MIKQDNRSPISDETDEKNPPSQRIVGRSGRTGKYRQIRQFGTKKCCTNRNRQRKRKCRVYRKFKSRFDKNT